MKIQNRSTATAALASAALLPVLLAACGGGGGDSSSPAPNPAPQSLVVTGTAATGAALASASVKLTCATGTATVTASATGTFSATIANGALPCVLTATSSDGKTELHSVAAGTGSAATTANITPLTELLIARLAGGDPKTFVSGFAANTAISASDVAAAQTALLQSLTNAGLNTSAVTDIVSGSLTAGSGAGYDGVLDKLGTLLKGANAALSDLAGAVASSNKSGSDTTGSVLGTVLAAAPGDCPGFKTGTLRVLDLTGAKYSLMKVDTTAMTVTGTDGTFPLTKNAACDYKIGNPASTRALVSRSGIVIFTSGIGTGGQVGVAFPEQKLEVAALAGNYDFVNYDVTGYAGFGDTVFTADGKNGLSHNCNGYGACADDAQTKGRLVANANGGFDYADDPQGDHARVFAFRNASGRNFLVAQHDDGAVTVLAAKDKLALPAVSRVAGYWQLSVNSAGLSTTVADANTITAADPVTGLVSRSFANDSHTDKLTYNAPYDGMRYRAANACLSSTGGAYACNAVVQLPYGGVQVAVSADPTKNFVTVTVDKP
jgi:hypothetical protein